MKHNISITISVTPGRYDEAIGILVSHLVYSRSAFSGCKHHVSSNDGTLSVDFAHDIELVRPEEVSDEAARE